MGTIILSALVAHTAWHWMAERWGVLSKYRIPWPELTPGFTTSDAAMDDAGGRDRGVVWWVRVVRKGKARKEEGSASEVVDRVAKADLLAADYEDERVGEWRFRR